MKQSNYETIMRCIQYGAPAMANELINDFNQSINDANSFIDIQMKAKAEAERKASVKNAVESEAPNADAAVRSKK